MAAAHHNVKLAISELKQKDEFPAWYHKFRNQLRIADLTLNFDAAITASNNPTALM